MNWLALTSTVVLITVLWLFAKPDQDLTDLEVRVGAMDRTQSLFRVIYGILACGLLWLAGNLAG